MLHTVLRHHHNKQHDEHNKQHDELSPGLVRMQARLRGISSRAFLRVNVSQELSKRTSALQRNEGGFLALALYLCMLVLYFLMIGLTVNASRTYSVATALRAKIESVGGLADVTDAPGALAWIGGAVGALYSAPNTSTECNRCAHYQAQAAACFANNGTGAAIDFTDPASLVGAPLCEDDSATAQAVTTMPCSSMAGQGWCTSSPYPGLSDFVRQHCLKSCGSCTAGQATPPAACADASSAQLLAATDNQASECAHIASHCETSPHAGFAARVQGLCPLTCGLCASVGSGAAAPVVVGSNWSVFCRTSGCTASCQI